MRLYRSFAREPLPPPSATNVVQISKLSLEVLFAPVAADIRSHSSIGESGLLFLFRCTVYERPLYHWCRENDPFCGTYLAVAKSLIPIVLDRRKSLLQKESMKIGYARVSTGGTEP